jgi:shikimate dehydrogenase
MSTDPVADDDGSYMGFVGVSTTQSSIMRVFPAWAETLGLPTRRLIGHDVPVDSPADRYRELVTAIHRDPHHRGALVTTHKMAVYAAAHQLFDELDDLAVTFGEISSIAKRGGRLFGAAKDPITVRLALEEFVAADHFAQTGAAALILGSGGSGCALSHQLGLRTDVPSEVICTALRDEDLDHQRTIHERAGIAPGLMRYVQTTGSDAVDDLLSQLPPGSLVVNATGMGKDRPGSPLTGQGVFPPDGLVWEFNYRGSLEFLHQAREQAPHRRLTVEDGWRYFIHGWSQVVADVFAIPMPHDTVDELARVAAAVR